MSSFYQPRQPTTLLSIKHQHSQQFLEGFRADSSWPSAILRGSMRNNTHGNNEPLRQRFMKHRSKHAGLSQSCFPHLQHFIVVSAISICPVSLHRSAPQPSASQARADTGTALAALNIVLPDYQTRTSGCCSQCDVAARSGLTFTNKKPVRQGGGGGQHA